MEHQELEIHHNLTICAIRNEYDITKIDCLDIEQLNYDKFFSKYVLQNLPCVIKNVTSRWECGKKWVLNEKINHVFLTKNYGEEIAPVADCNNFKYNSQCKSEMKVKDYISYLQQPDHDKLLYLKDWHLRKAKPTDQFYQVPFIFGADWLNEYAIDKEEDDFMFVYIGPAGSWTPLHADVYSSFSWSVNVIGRKKWIFFIPKEEEKLKDLFGNLPLLFDCQKNKNVRYFELIQERGDAIFVPSGWYHQVTNIEDTISVNHNWINACNLELVWKSLEQSLTDVEKEIYDIRDSPEYFQQCQLILKSIFGMDFNDFTNLLCHIFTKRLMQLEGKEYLIFNKYKLGINHIKFDLKNIVKVFDYIIQHPLIQNKNIDLNTEYDLPKLVFKMKSIKDL